MAQILQDIFVHFELCCFMGKKLSKLNYDKDNYE